MTQIVQTLAVTRLCDWLSPVNFYMRDADRMYTGNTGRKYWLRDDETFTHLSQRLNRSLSFGLVLILVAAIFLGVNWAMLTLCWVVAGTFIFEHTQIKERGVRVPNAADEFLLEIRRQLPGCTVTPDFPNAWQGEAFFDIEAGESRCTVSFKPGAGFGLYSRDSRFRERPNCFVTSVSGAVALAADRIIDGKS